MINFIITPLNNEEAETSFMSSDELRTIWNYMEISTIQRENNPRIFHWKISKFDSIPLAYTTVIILRPLKGEPIECIIPFPIMRIVFVQVESTEIEMILGAMENSGSDTIKATPLFFGVKISQVFAETEFDESIWSLYTVSIWFVIIDDRLWSGLLLFAIGNELGWY